MALVLLIQAEALFGLLIERPPEDSIEDDDECAHHGYAEDDALEVALGCGIGDISTDPVRRQLCVAPAYRFCNDARIERPPGGSDCSGEVVRKHRGQRDVAPPVPAADLKARPDIKKLPR